MLLRQCRSRRRPFSIRRGLEFCSGGRVLLDRPEKTMKLPIFMDYHSTTPVDPRVLEAMMPYFTHDFGNAASRNHPFGWHAEKATEIAREQVGALIGASAKEIVWTSGATESINLDRKSVV